MGNQRRRSRNKSKKTNKPSTQVKLVPFAVPFRSAEKALAFAKTTLNTCRGHMMELPSVSVVKYQSEVFTSHSATCVGVYAGHGGPESSRFIFPHLHKQVGLSADVIKRDFESTRHGFLRLVNNSWMAHPQIDSVGSCCLVGAIPGHLLYVANLGKHSDRDKGLVMAEMLSTDHNVAVEEVRMEVEALHPDDAHVVALYTRGGWRFKGIFEVSSSIEDALLNKLEFYKDPLFQQFGSPLPLKQVIMTAESSRQIRKLPPLLRLPSNG